MRLLFFDMEFANGKVPGSIYSIGYVMTDENFEVLEPLTDLLINPACAWNDYVEKNILVYPKEQVESAPEFPMLYGEIRELFESSDMAIGFAVNNDVRALRKNCERYGLEQLRYRAFDTERLCRKAEEHKDAHGLAGYFRAWCGEEPDNRHRSDGDAYATMLLFRKICEVKHVTPEMMLAAYPECVQSSVQPVSKTKQAAKAKGGAASRGKRHRRGRRGGKKSAPDSVSKTADISSAT